MTDTDTTDDATATAAAAGGAVELALRLIPPAAWEGMFLLGKIATDPKAIRRHLRQLHDSLVAEAEAQKKTQEDRAAFDEYKAKETAELDEQKKTAASIWERAQSRERAVDAREQACRERETALGLNARNPDDDFVPMQGSGMSRTYPRTVRHDDLGQAFPEHTTLTRQTETPEPEGPVGARARPGRKIATAAGA
jgi:hypothetical protein